MAEPRPDANGASTVAPLSIQANARLAVEAVTGRRHFTRDDRAREAAVARRIGARIQVDVIDERRLQDARAGREVIQVRHRDAVEEVTHVAGRRAAHVEIRQPADDRHHARQRFDRAIRIAESAGHVVHVGVTERVFEWFFLTDDQDLLHRRFDRGRGRRMSRIR